MLFRSGYEVRGFHEAGHDVTAIEFSVPAVARARTLLGPLGDNVILGDFFEHDFGKRPFGLIYERGFLCSFPPTRWPAYASRMASLLPTGGRLVGLFLYGDEPDPPPFPMTPEIAASLLGRSFRLRQTEQVSESPPVYQGLEHWQEWQKVDLTSHPAPAPALAFSVQRRQRTRTTRTRQSSVLS